MIDNYKGCMIGAAVGDAFAMPYEFKNRGTFKCKENMIRGGVFDLEKGYYTDDSSQILCLANSLLENNGEFNRIDFMEKLVDWYLNGYMSATGGFIDIGMQTRIVLDQYAYNKEFVIMDDESQSGNGSLMRICPIPMMFSLDEIPSMAEQSSNVTHASRTSIECCVNYSILIRHALEGATKEKLKELSGFNLSLNEFNSSGYVLDSYRTALYGFFNTNSFKECIMFITDLGLDTDTNACIAGMLAGAYYGIDGIPDDWKRDLKDYELFETTAERLFFMRN